MPKSGYYMEISGGILDFICILCQQTSEMCLFVYLSLSEQTNNKTVASTLMGANERAPGWEKRNQPQGKKSQQAEVLCFHHGGDLLRTRSPTGHLGGHKHTRECTTSPAPPALQCPVDSLRCVQGPRRVARRWWCGGHTRTVIYF